MPVILLAEVVHDGAIACAPAFVCDWAFVWDWPFVPDESLVRSGPIC
jgi:hypothetical protein